MPSSVRSNRRHRRGDECKGKLALADRQCRGTVAIVQAHLLLGPLPVPEREHPLPPADRHPARRSATANALRPARLSLRRARIAATAAQSSRSPARAGRRRQVLQFAFDEAGVDGVGADVRMRHQRRQEGNVGDDAANVGLLKPAIEPLDRGFAGRRPRDHLGQHGVVMRRDRIALAISGIDAQAVGCLRHAPGPDAADRRHEILVRVFRIDPRLDGVAVQPDLVLRQRQLFAERDPQLPFHEIDAGDQFGHGMLDLQARVHLDEEHVLAVGDEFDGAGADIIDRARPPCARRRRPPRAASASSVGDGASSITF